MERKLKVRNSHSELMLNCSGKGFFFFPSMGNQRACFLKPLGVGKEALGLREAMSCM